jgi:acyl dehydratase
MAAPIIPLADYPGLIGKEIGITDWVTVDQAMIDRFADLTGDRQFIHVDPVKAAATPLGGTIAHGFLTLSLLGGMGMDIIPLPAGMVMSMNYGFDKVRFLAPVRSGGRVRGRFTLTGLEAKGKGQHMLHYAASMEIEGEAKPALAADWLIMVVVPDR